MRRCPWIVLACAVVVLLALPIAAQQRYGALEGEAVNQDGQVLPGVAVTLSGPNMMGDRTAVSDANGAFRIVLVPPGRYTVTASLSGFQTVVQEALPVGLDSSVRVRIAMEEGFEGVLEVYADQVLIDHTSSKVGVNITDDFIENLPTDRQYQMVMSMLPGVVEDNNPMVHGSSSYDNMYLIDGADTSDPMTRTWGTALNFDDIQEVQVTTGGVSAEYGKGTGALVNLVTKSGSNELHGLARFTYSDIDLNSPARGDRYYFSDPTRYLSEQRWGANLGGPIVRDRLWFFVSYESRDKRKPISYWASPEDLLNAGEGTVEEINQNISKGETSYTGHYLSGKLSWSPSPGHQVMASYLEDPIDIPRINAYKGSQGLAADADQVQVQGGSNVVLNWTGILSENVFLDFRYNLKRDQLDQLPMGEGTTYLLANTAGWVFWGNATEDYRTNRYHDIWALTYNHFVDELAGSHQLKIGAEYTQIDIDHYDEEYPGDELIQFVSDGSEPWRRWVTLQRRGWRSTRTTSTALFIQDSWVGD